MTTNDPFFNYLHGTKFRVKINFKLLFHHVPELYFILCSDVEKFLSEE